MVENSTTRYLQDTLDALLKENFKILIDTCSMLKEDGRFEKFWEMTKPILQKYNSYIIIPNSVCMELLKHQGNKTNLALSKLANNAIIIVNEGYRGGAYKNSWRGTRWKFC
ncbi:MAG: hypothetical protein IJT33_08335 [Campylobacter sp.]|nr:hypothetical protein [Campylobacter sp.]MBQ7271170.1 hypothetical protein [Campylobacter sp.]MBQ7676444.1 hypothetical protein [Campylobacter sp.]MBR0070724.1 hypothetical protein [Campylobacter sp.]